MTATQQLDSREGITYLCHRWAVRLSDRLQMGFLSDLASHHRYLGLFPFYDPPISQLQSNLLGEYGFRVQDENQETNCFTILF